MVKLRIFVLLSVLVLGLLATTGSASAAYLCPVVGDGVLTADIVIQKPWTRRIRRT